MSKYFKCTTNKNPLEYTCGEKIIFTVSARDNRQDTLGRFVKWELDGDDGQKSSGFDACWGGHPIVIETTLKKAGFVRLTCTAYNENYAPDSAFEVLTASAGADVDTLSYLDTVPDDFDSYWSELKDIVDNFNCELISSEEVTTGVPEGIKCYDVRISTPQGRPVSGYLSIPTAEGKYPIRVTLLGYSVVGAWTVHDPCAISACFNAHGIENGPCRTEAELKYKDELNNYGFSKEENASNMTTYWRNMMMRDLIGLKYLKQMPQWDGENLSVSGGSQGAFQSTIMASVDPDVSFLNIQVPWFCNMRAEQFGFVKGSRPEFAEGLRYFDTVAHAMRVKCPVKIKIGLGDYTCPPSGTITLYNTFNCEKEAEIIQAMKHQLTPPLEDEHFYKSNCETKLGKYRHYKGNEYEVLGTAFDSESGQRVVIYKALYGKQKIWTRLEGVFNEYILHNGKFIKRFEYIG